MSYTEEEKREIITKSFELIDHVAQLEPRERAPVSEWRVPDPEPTPARQPKLDTRQHDDWRGWETWLRSHLDNERQHQRALLTEVTAEIFERIDNTAAELRGEIKSLHAEVERVQKFADNVLTAVIASGKRE